MTSTLGLTPAVVTVLESLPDAVYVLDAGTLSLIHANEAGCLLLGHSRAALRELTLSEVSAEDAAFTLTVARAYHGPILRGERVPSIEWHMRRGDGQTFWCDFSFKRADLDGRNFLMVVARDVTARRAEPLNRLYAVLSEVGRTIVQCGDAPSLFRQVSEILAMIGGMTVAAFGLADGDDVVVGGAAGLGGFEQDPAAILRRACEAGAPAAIALAEGRTVVCSDLTDACPLSRRGAADPPIPACAAFPLHARRGVLFVCHEERGFFGASQMEALEQVVEEVDLALAHLEMTEQRQRLQRDVDVLNHENRIILESAPHGIVSVDARGDVTTMNPAACRVLGFEVDDLRTRSFHEAVHWSSIAGRACPKEDGPIARVLAGEGASSPSGALFRRKGGGSFPVECAVAPLVDRGEMRGAVVSFVDVTYHHEVARMKGEFVSVVSHELRTPLTSIRGALGLLAGGVLGDLPDKGRRMLDIALGNTDRLVRLLNDILDLERMQSGKMSLQRGACRGDELLVQAAEAVRAVAQEAALSVRVDAEPVMLEVDADRLMQVLTNLLGNAIKFSPEGTVVNLALRHDQGHALFEVRDHGRGIPADMLEVVFERFAQVDASDARQHGGTGLGLAICRGIVEAHGGRIWADNASDGGSVFRFTMPLAGAAPT